MARDAMPAWTKSPQALADAFAAALDAFPGVERRAMFGYPAAFTNGNLWTGLHQSTWMVRLPPEALVELLAIDGAAPFAPMPGRVMRGYATLPPSVLADPESLHGWLGRSLAYVRSLPPKEGGRPK